MTGARLSIAKPAAWIEMGAAPLWKLIQIELIEMIARSRVLRP
jgi:hypothetical protein